MFAFAPTALEDRFGVYLHVLWNPKKFEDSREHAVVMAPKILAGNDQNVLLVEEPVESLQLPAIQPAAAI